MTKTKLNKRQGRWVDFLAEYNFTIEHQPGKEAVIPDALSRRPDYIKKKVDRKRQLIPPNAIKIKTIRICALSIQELDKQIMDSYYETPEWNEEVKEFNKIGRVVQEREKGLFYIYTKWKKVAILLRKGSSIIKEILKEYHDSESAGHP